MLIAQLTDNHLFATPERELYEVVTARSFETVFTHLQSLTPRPDLLLFTGDLSQDMTRTSYQYLRDLIEPLAIPTYWLPGNHDDPRVMMEVFKTGLVSVRETILGEDWTIILLNSGVFGQEQGYLEEETLAWLEGELQKSNQRPVMIVFHHPPLVIGETWADSMVINSEDFLRVIEPFAQVKIVLFGHIHQAFEEERGGVFFLGTPSTCKQFDEKGKGVLQQPGFRLLKLNSDGSWSTRVERVKFF